MHDLGLQSHVELIYLVRRNAFCRSIEDLGIEGMAEMYQALGAAGAAGFHFVSNSPNELLPVIREYHGGRFCRGPAPHVKHSLH